MCSRKSMEVRWEGVADGKRWGIPLKEDVSLEDDFPPLLFSSMLFEKFFDPSDAFPLWEFEPDNLLIGDTRAAIDWFHTNTEYVLSSELPGKCTSKLHRKCSFDATKPWDWDDMKNLLLPLIMKLKVPKMVMIK
ncbi:hypothetical protein AMTRI_Chr02g258960 [Amborella trichopoda]